MPIDRYTSFVDLFAAEKEDEDYRLVVCDRESSDLIIAPHGGEIEPRTSEIARMVAGEEKSLYLFEGLKTNRPHCDLHITSHLYDEPKALQIAMKASRIVAIHGRADGSDPETIWVGGLDLETGGLIRDYLVNAGFKCENADNRLAGANQKNICNRGAGGRGVQLEIPRSLRTALGKCSVLMTQFANAVRDALDTAPPPKLDKPLPL